jgi:hypothetical protein
MGFQIQGGVSGTAADVNVDNELKTTLTQDETKCGVVGMYSVNDDSTVRTLKSPFTSEDYRLNVGQDTELFNYVFNSLTQDTGCWSYAFTTMTFAQSGGFLQLNSAALQTTGTGAYLRTWAQFGLQVDGGLFFQTTLQIPSTIQANQVFSFGLGLPISATAVPTDGVWFQLTSAGLIGVILYNGSQTQTGTLLSTATLGAVNHQYGVVVHSRQVEFWVDNVLLNVTLTPSGNGAPVMSNALPLFFQATNSGTVVGTACILKVANLDLAQLDTPMSLPWHQVQTRQGRHAYQGTDGNTMGSTALFANSANPTAAVPTNTTAALGTGLGGNFWSTNTIAINTDGIISSFQVPVGGINAQPRSLMVFGVRIDTTVQLALANAGGAIYVWSLAFGHTAVSLATADTGSFVTATTKSARRIAVGQQVAVGALVQGSQLATIQWSFASRWECPKPSRSWRSSLQVRRSSPASPRRCPCPRASRGRSAWPPPCPKPSRSRRARSPRPV